MQKEKLQVPQFKEMKIGDTSLYIGEPKKTLDYSADFAQSMAVLKESEKKPITYQEFFALVGKNKRLALELVGKWFYLEARGIKETGYYKIDFKTGELEKISDAKSEKLDNEEKVLFWREVPEAFENELLILSVDGNSFYWKFYLDTTEKSSSTFEDFSHVIVGIDQNVANIASRSTSSNPKKELRH